MEARKHASIFFESRYVHCGLEILFPTEFLDSNSRAGLLFHLHSAAQPVTFSDGKDGYLSFVGGTHALGSAQTWRVESDRVWV